MPATPGDPSEAIPSFPTLHDLLSARLALPESPAALSSLFSRYTASANTISPLTGLTPLTLVVAFPLPRLPSRRLVTAVLDATGASPTLRDGHNHTPAAAAISANALHLLDIFIVAGVSPNSPPLLPLVLAAPPHIPTPTRSRAITALLALGATADSVALATSLNHRRLGDAAVLLAHGAPPAAQDDAGNNAAHLAVAALAKTAAAVPPSPDCFLAEALSVLGAVLRLHVAPAARNDAGCTPRDLLRTPPACFAERPAGGVRVSRRRPRQARRAVRDAQAALALAAAGASDPDGGGYLSEAGGLLRRRAANIDPLSVDGEAQGLAASQAGGLRRFRRCGSDGTTAEMAADLRGPGLRLPLAQVLPDRARGRMPGSRIIQTVASVESLGDSN